MTNKINKIEELRTEVTGLKIRIQRIEDFLLQLPNVDEYIHQSQSTDELFEEAKKIVSQYDRASASLIQRRLMVGYARAARILDELEEAGVVSSEKFGEPREVLIKKSESKSNKK